MLWSTHQCNIEEAIAGLPAILFLRHEEEEEEVEEVPDTQRSPPFIGEGARDYCRRNAKTRFSYFLFLRLWLCGGVWGGREGERLQKGGSVLKWERQPILPTVSHNFANHFVLYLVTKPRGGRGGGRPACFLLCTAALSQGFHLWLPMWP